MDAEQSLLELVSSRLATDGVPAEVAEIVLAAYSGIDELNAALAGGGHTPRTPEQQHTSRPDPLYLAAISVTGFRGIGPTASLRVAPHPGLTLVVGRNGSGKSSFAEAAELALTGDSARWAEHNSVFRAGWRNLHNGQPCIIEVMLRSDGAPATTRISRAWADSTTEVGCAETTVVSGGVPHQDTGELGWAAPLQTYRPFLTANDLGKLISATPSGLFDALAPILGIEPLTEADRRLMQVRKQIDERVRMVKARRDDLRARLQTIDDDRARKAATILGKRQPDLAALDALLGGADEESADPVAAACRRLVAAALPERDSVLRAADGLDATHREFAAATAGATAAQQQTADLLESAITYHDEHGDGPCPVCGTGLLDAGWQARSVQTLARLRERTAAADQAGRRLRDAVEAARTHAGIERTLPTGDLDTAAPALGPAAEPLREALTRWRASTPAADPEDLAAQLRGVFPALHEAFTAAQSAAAGWLRQRHDAWREHAAALQGWLAEAHASTGDELALGTIKAAREWLRRASEELRAARLAPFSAQSQQIWEKLRQESNVELGGMTLEGTSTRRRVVLPATVDGSATTAMAVMSQGELQALGLAVFLPRACAQASPFKFLILDDPVHSMDPSKVDGLAQVLAELAKDRQVIVFTHDNRLPDAVRRLQLDATIWEVLRREGSTVELRKNLDPASRYLADADALAKTKELAEQVRRPVVAGFCRSAIEVTCHARIRRVRIERGEPHANVDRLIERAHSLTQTVALALFDDAHKGALVLPRLNKLGRWAGDVFKACQEDVHGATKGNLQSLVDDTAKLVRELKLAREPR